MSKQRSLAVTLALAAAALATVGWLALRPRPTERGAVRDAAATPADAPPESLPGAAREAPVAAGRAGEASLESRREVRRDAARSVRVDVALPPGTPADESIEVFAASFSLAELGSAEAVEQAIAQYRARHGRSFEAPSRTDGARNAVREVPCERVPDGSFVAVFERDAARGALSLRARYAYVDGGVVIVDLPAEGVRIEPDLGAWFTARLRPPAPLPDDVDLSTLEPFRAQLFGWRARGGDRDTVSLSCEVGADLAFELGGVPPGYRCFFQADPGAFVPVFDTELAFEAGQHVDREFALALGVRVEGTVVDASGAGVAGALVAASANTWRWGGSDRKAQSDAEGRFALRGIAAGEVDVRAQREGYVAASLDGLRGADGQTLAGLVLELERGLTLRGRVVWPDGAPAIGASVSTSEVERDASERGGSLRTSASFADTTDADGRFERSGLVGPTFAVRAEAERAGRKWTAVASEVAASSEVLLTLAEPHDVAGRVVDDRGAPVAAFMIQASRADVAIDSAEFSTEQRPFEARSDGRFAVDLPEGAWTLSATAAGHAESESVRVGSPHTGGEVVLTAPRLASVRGVVVDPSGAPVAGAHVGASGDARGRRWGGDDVEATTDAEGRFELQSVAPGGATLRATHAAWAPSAPLDLVVAAGDEASEIELALRIGGRLEGEIYTSSGAPDPGRRIMVGNFAALGQEGGMATSDAAGHFAVEHLAAGTYQVVAEPRMDGLGGMVETDPAAVFASLKMVSVEIRDGETAHVVLGAPPKAPVRLSGTVTRSGEPVAGGMVMAIREGAPVLDSMKMAPIRAGGRYDVTLDEPGDYTLIAGEEFGNDGGVEFHETIPAVAEFQLDLALPNGAIRGRVVDDGGRPLGGIEVGIEREGEVSIFSLAEGRSERTGEDGRFAFTSLAPGRYRLRAPHSSAVFFGGEPAAYGVAVRSGIELGAEALVDGIELALTAPGAIRGCVRDADGAPVARAAIHVRGESGEVLNRVSSCASDAGGRFEFGGASPGSYTVFARAGALASRESPAVRVTAGESAEVELKLEPGTILRVTIEDESGAPVRASVRVVDDAGRDVGGVYGNEALERLLSEGTSSTEQRFGPLPAGSYRVLATGPDGESVNKPVKLSGQEERSLKIKLKE